MKKKGSILFFANVIAIITLYIYGSAGGFESAAIQTIIEAWPGETAVAIRMMLTVPAIVQAVIMVGIGPLFGKYIRYRRAGIIGLALVALGGTVPAFYAPTWLFVLVCRGVGIGGGAGLLSMRTALLIKSVPHEDRGKWIGIAGACASLLSMVFMPLSGVLAQLRWNYCFLVNILAFACLVFSVFFLKEPADEPAEPAAAAAAEERISGDETGGHKERPAGTGTAARMNPRVILYVLIVFITNAIVYSAISGLSTIFMENGLGGAGAAGITTSLYCLAGATGSLLLKLIQKAFRYQLITICSIACGAGILIVTLAPSAIAATFGMMLTGFNFFPIVSSLQVYNGEDQPPERLAFSSILIMMGTMTAIFCSNLFILLCGKVLNFRNSEVSSALLAGSVIFVLMGIFWAVTQTRRKKG